MIQQHNFYNQLALAPPYNVAPTEVFPRLIEDTIVLPRQQHVKVGLALGQGAIAAASQFDSWGSGFDRVVQPTTMQRIVGEHYRGSFEEQATLVRDALSSLADEDKHWIEPYLDGCARRAYQGKHALRPVGRGDTPWSEWLPSAADEQLVDFMSVHLDILKEQSQSPELLEAVANGKNAFVGGVRSLIIEDKLHPEASVSIDAIKQTDVYVGDYWDTRLLGIAGYHYEGGDNYIVLGQGVGETEKEADRQLVASAQLLILHEGGHIKFANHFPRWRKEAVVHHIAVAIDNGEFDVIDPMRRAVRDGYYEEERTLLHVVHTKGKRPVPIEAATRAASAQASYEQEDQRMKRQLDDAWEWPDMLESIDAHVLILETWLREHQPNLPAADISFNAVTMMAQQLQTYADGKFGHRNEQLV